MILREHWAHRSLEKDIRQILAAQGRREVTREECKAWVRLFMKATMRNWEPGTEMTWKQARKLGRAFDKLLATVQEPKDEPRKRRSRVRN